MKKNSQVFSQFLKNNVHLLAYMVMSVLLVASLLTQFLPTGVPLQNVLVFFFFFVCVGFVVFEHMSFLRAIAPNVRVHQIAQRYVGVYMRLLIVSIRFISYGALAFLSARVIRLTLRVFVHHQFIESLWFIVVLMFVMAMPAYMGYEAAWPMVSFFVVCALVMLVGTLAYALFFEMQGGVQGEVIAHMRARAYELSSQTMIVYSHSPLRSVVVLMFPVAVLALFSERVGERKALRRVSRSVLLSLMVSAGIFMGVMLYFISTFHLPGYATYSVLLVMTDVFFHPYVTYFVAAVYIVVLAYVGISSFWRCQRLVKELSFMDVLPAHLRYTKRSFTMFFLITILIVLHGLSLFISDDSYVELFVFNALVLLFLLLSAISVQQMSRQQLRSAISYNDRRKVKRNLLVFFLLSFIYIGLLITILFIQPRVFLLIFLALATMVALMLLLRGRYRRNRKGTTELIKQLDTNLKVNGIVILESHINHSFMQAITYALSMKFASLTAIIPDYRSDFTSEIKKQWEALNIPSSLTCVSTRRLGVHPVITYIDNMRKVNNEELFIVFLPFNDNLVSRLFAYRRRKLKRVCKKLDKVLVMEVPYRTSTESDSNG